MMGSGNEPIVLKFDKESVSKDALLAAAYQFSGSFSADLTVEGDGAWQLKLTPLPGCEHGITQDLVKNAVLEHELRTRLDDKFGSIRDRIFEFAFSPIAGVAEKKN